MLTDIFIYILILFLTILYYLIWIILFFWKCFYTFYFKDLWEFDPQKDLKPGERPTDEDNQKSYSLVMQFFWKFWLTVLFLMFYIQDIIWFKNVIFNHVGYVYTHITEYIPNYLENWVIAGGPSNLVRRYVPKWFLPFYDAEVSEIFVIQVLFGLIFFYYNWNKISNLFIFRLISLFFSIFILVLSLYFAKNTNNFQFNYQLSLILESDWKLFDFFLIQQLDGISLFFILLTTFIIPICILVSWEIVGYLKEFLICLFLVEFFLLIAFSTNNLLIFFVAFESILIPMFLIIGIWGVRFERIKAAYWFFFYTLIGSIFFLFNLLYIQSFFGTFDYNHLVFIEQEIPVLHSKLLWLFFFFAFAVKIPMFPFHIWLPEAHVEAPTSGSILLASLLLKLGGYGFLRFSIGLFPLTSKYFLPLIVTLCFIGITYSSLVTLRQLDLKRLIAYSSIAHMNYIVLGLFSFTHSGIVGAILLMLSHGIVASGLFFLVGVLYDRHHVRLLNYYSGLVTVMPVFSFFFGFFTFANMSFPGLANFPGELLILIGLTEINFLIALSTVFGLFLSACYSVWLLNRLIFGSLKTNYTSIFLDISRREFYSILPLIILTLVIGLFPNFFLTQISFSVSYFLEIINIK